MWANADGVTSWRWLHGQLFDARQGLEAGTGGLRPAAPAAAAPALAARRVDVTLREYAVAPSSAVGRAGRVTFAVRNAGAIPHELAR